MAKKVKAEKKVERSQEMSKVLKMAEQLRTLALALWVARNFHTQYTYVYTQISYLLYAAYLLMTSESDDVDDSRIQAAIAMKGALVTLGITINLQNGESPAENPKLPDLMAGEEDVATVLSETKKLSRLEHIQAFEELTPRNVENLLSAGERGWERSVVMLSSDAQANVRCSLAQQFCKASKIILTKLNTPRKNAKETRNLLFAVRDGIWPFGMEAEIRES